MRSSSRPPPSYSSAPPPGRICRICATCCPLLRSTVDLTVPPSLRRLLEALHAAGGRPFLVGGAVRDAVLGLPIAEYDVEVFGLPAEALKQQLSTFGAVNTVGEAFTVFKVAGIPDLAGAVDVSLPRRDSKAGPGHRGIAVVGDPQLPVEEAGGRRGFTFSAML